MQIVKLMGGFANQVRQYIYGRYLEHCIGEPVYYDDSWFLFNKLHNGYELKRVYGLNLRLITEYFPDFILKKSSGIMLYQLMYDAGVDIDLVLAVNSKNITFTGRTIKFDQNTAFIPVNNSRYHMTYAGEYYLYYQEIKDLIDRELIFPPLPNAELISLAEEIECGNSVGIHVRLGDFANVGWLSSPEYYKKCIGYAEKNFCPDCFYVFSNDLSYLKRHMDEYGFSMIANKVKFINANRGQHDYIDFQLMTLCKHLIVSYYSSFSECACAFNKNKSVRIDHQTIGMSVEDFWNWKKED